MAIECPEAGIPGGLGSVTASNSYRKNKGQEYNNNSITDEQHFIYKGDMELCYRQVLHNTGQRIKKRKEIAAYGGYSRPDRQLQRLSEFTIPVKDTTGVLAHESAMKRQLDV